MKTFTKVMAASLLVLGCALTNGCYAVAAGTAAGAYAYNAGDENKANFAKVNAQRQESGLPPLTWDEYMHPGTSTTPTK